MGYMIILGFFVLSIFIFISYKQQNIVNGLLICTASIIVFNVILPVTYQLYNPQVKLNYMYILIYYGVYYVAIASGYYIFVKSKKFENIINIDVDYKSSKIFKYIILFMVFLICALVVVNVPVDYLKNPRLLYENTRLGFGHIYFLLAMLLNIYFIFSMFTEKKYYYMIIVFVLLYFTGSKSRMLIPIEMFFLYYFYVKTKDRNNIKKIVLWGSGIIICFLGIFIMTSYYLPDRSINTIVNSLANYSDYNRNFLQLVDKMSETKEYFHGLISTENNFVSLVPRVLWENKPTIFGSFRLSYMIYPEWTLLFQGAPSFGSFGAIFADFGHLSIIFIFIQNFVIGGLIAITEKMFIRKKNPVTFMIFLVFMGILVVDIGISATTILIINLIFVAMMYITLRVIERFKENKLFDKVED